MAKRTKKKISLEHEYIEDAGVFVLKAYAEDYDGSRVTVSVDLNFKAYPNAPTCLLLGEALEEMGRQFVDAAHKEPAEGQYG